MAKAYWNSGNVVIQGDWRLNINQIYTFDALYSNGQCRTNGDYATSFTYGDSLSLAPLYFLASRSAGGRAESFTYCKLYKLEITGEGTPLRDYYPCYNISTGEIGLYDMVSDSFFGNNGTGVFLKGADIVLYDGNESAEVLMLRRGKLNFIPFSALLINAPLSQETGLQNLVTGQNAIISDTGSANYDSNFGAYFFKPRKFASTSGQYLSNSGIGFPIYKNTLHNKLTIEFDVYPTLLIRYSSLTKGFGMDVVPIDWGRTYWITDLTPYTAITNKWLSVKVEKHKDGPWKIYIDGELKAEGDYTTFESLPDVSYLQFAQDVDGRRNYHCEGYFRNIKVYTE